jgi:hypothetical protein
MTGADTPQPIIKARGCTDFDYPTAPRRLIASTVPRVYLKLALAGDTMLGRGVAERLRFERPSSLFAPEVVEARS